LSDVSGKDGSVIVFTAYANAGLMIVRGVNNRSKSAYGLAVWRGSDEVA
jgi:hypothetical protein